MRMNREEVDKSFRMASLIMRHVKQEITGTEKIELEEWINERPENEKLFQQLISGSYNHLEIKKIKQRDAETAWQRVQSRIQPRRTIKKPFYSSVSVWFKVAGSERK